jgi:hypothetical protein
MDQWKNKEYGEKVLIRNCGNYYNDLDIVANIKKKRLEWIKHLIRMDNERVVKRIFENKLEGRRRMGRPRLRWLGDAEKDPREMKVKRW